MRRVLLPIMLLLILTVLLTACPQQTQPAPAEPEVITETVEREVTVIVEGTPVVETVTETVVVTATPDPAAVEEPAEEAMGPQVMVICMAQEPTDLSVTNNALVVTNVLQAVMPDFYHARSFGYEANLWEKMPSLDDGDATVEEVTLSEGDQFVDVLSDSIMTLTAGMTETFALNQLEGAPVEYEGWDGEELTTVQMTAEWTLLEGITWQDGEPFTTGDVVFTYEMNFDPDWPASAYTAERTETFEAVDDLTMRWVSLPGFVDGTFFVNAQEWAVNGMLPRHLYEGMSYAEIQEDVDAQRNPIGYGPYMIESWETGQAITLVPNPHWFRGEPNLEQLIYRFVPDTNQLIAQLVGGDCDVGTQDAGFEGSMALLEGFEQQGVLVVQNVVGTVFEHLNFNMMPVDDYTGAAATLTDNEGNLLFQNVNFRRAIAHCIDRQAIVDTAVPGGFVQHVYTPDIHPLYAGDDVITIYEHDPEQGRALLEELGWTGEEGQVLTNAQGQTLSFRHTTTTATFRQAVTQVVQEQLMQNCGIQTEIELLPGTELFADGPDGPLFGRRFDLGEFAWLTGVEPPCTLYQSQFIPSEENGWGNNNNTGFSNPEFDAACNNATQTLDEEEKAQYHAEAMRIFTEELPAITLFARAKIAVHRPEVQGLEMDATINSDTWNIENFRLAAPQQ
jgi:peptide/nickel transport system substrate-binding protein